MEQLSIKGTNTTPYICLNPNTFVLDFQGYSRPENVRDFYDPILRWLNDFRSLIETKKLSVEHNQIITVNFKMVYFNSSSAKFICDIIVLLRDISREGFNIEVNWIYDESDSEMFEAGEELSDMSDFKFSFIPVK